MDEWKEVALDDVATLNGGFAFKSSQYTESGRFVLRTVNITDDFAITKDGATFISECEAADYDRFSLQEHDTLFVMVAATLGKVGYVRSKDLPALLNQNMWVIRARANKIDPVFLHYAFREISKIPLSWVGGSARSFLRRDDVRTLRFSLPPAAEQQAIASILAALDDKIELNRRMNETLEGMAQAIFRDWFVDFGPTRRKAAGEADPVAVMGGLTPDPTRATELAALFPAAFGNDELPVGWKAGTLDRLALVNPESWKTKNHPAQVEYVDLSNTKWGSIEATANLIWEAAPSRARRIARTGDTIIGTVRPGNGSYAYIGRDGYTASTGFAVLRPKQAVYTDAIYVAATAADNISRLANLADGHGGAYPAVNPDVVAATPFPVVPDEVLAAFSSFASPLRAKIEQAKLENQTIAETRDYLLPRLMSGAVRVAPKVEAA